MAFTAIPVDGSATPIPMSSAVPDGTNTPLATEGGPSKATGGNTLVPVAVYEYDGYDVNAGSTLDAAVTGDVTGTVSAKLRGLSKIFVDMWDSTNHWLQVKVMNGNPNGQTTMSASAPVAVASDQSPIAIKNQPTSAVLFSTTQTGISSWSGSGDISGLSGYRELFANINITAITGTSIQLRLQRKDSFGNWITVDTSSALTGTGSTARSYGAGLSVNHSFGTDIQLLVIFNTITSVTFTLDLFAK